MPTDTMPMTESELKELIKNSVEAAINNKESLDEEAIKGKLAELPAQTERDNRQLR